MDDAQVTGSTSSYARKYALNGLFCIDDTKDPDTQDNSGNTGVTQKKMPLKTPEERKVDNEMTVAEENTHDDLKAKRIKQMYAIWYALKKNITDAKAETLKKYGASSIEQMSIEEIEEEIMSLRKVQEAQQFAEKAKDPTINF
jgi:hypothetical protein